MKYFKFLLKCILAASPAIFLIAYTLLCPFSYMDEEYPAWRYTIETVRGNVGEEKYDTVILGDSGAMSSFVPTLLSDSCVNLAVGGGTSLEMYYFMKEYLTNHDAPKNVIIMFAPFHYWNIDNYDTRTMYFKALSIKDAKDVYKYAKEYEVDSVYKEDVFWDEFACRTGLPTKYLPAITASFSQRRLSNNKEAYREITSNNGYGMFGRLDGCDGLSYECSYSSMDYGSEMILLSAYLQKLYELCESSGSKILLVQPALNEASYEAIDAGYVETYEAYIEMISGQCGNMKCETKLREYSNDYFGDVSHLNKKGAEKFSEEIKKLYPDYFG